jgi:diguanylate cyclase (GGDEF)-like protein
MKPHRGLGIRQTLWFATGLTVMISVLGAGLLYRYQLGLDRWEAERLRILAMTESYAVQAAPLILAGRRGEIDSFVRSLNWHPGSSLLAVCYPDNEVIAARGNKALIGEYVKLARADQPGESARAWRVPGQADRKLPPLNLAAITLHDPRTNEPLATVVYAARLAVDERISPGEVGWFFLSLLGISTLGMVLGFLWLRPRVLCPLHELVREGQSLDRAVDQPLPESLTGRADEIGDLARAIATMRRELYEWYRRATRLERSVDDRVAAQTQKITRELRLAEKQIWTDPLTRLGNRRLMDEKFEEIFRAQVEAGQDLSVVLLDLDYFKEVNDVLGHKSGDEMLVLVGELLKQCLREQDLAIRYGGDEFILVFPSVNADGARAIAERTIRLFTQQARVLRLDPKPSMSAGVASLQSHQPSDSNALLNLADQALYHAKRSGKSQVCIAPKTPALAASR